MLIDFHLLLGQIHPQQMRSNGWGAPNGCFYGWNKSRWMNMIPLKQAQAKI
jgi:hypothetical protein